MTKLNQVLAIQQGVQATAKSVLDKSYHQLQRAPLLAGLSRTYRPKDEEGEKLPPEGNLVQVKVEEIITDITAASTRLYDVVATKDQANTQASADVVVDGESLLTNVPVTFLLWLEKRLEDLHTFVGKLPVLEPGEIWDFDSNTNVYRTPVTETIRTKKVPRNHVKAVATDKHPAQVEVWMEDVQVGTWSATKFSGAIPAQRRAQLLERVNKLTEAVKTAREQANAITVTDVHVGEPIFAYLFGA